MAKVTHNTTERRHHLFIHPSTHPPATKVITMATTTVYIGVCVSGKISNFEFKVHTRGGAHVDVSLMHFINDHMTDPNQT